MDVSHSGELAVVGLIILVTQIAQRIGHRYLLLGGPACWLAAGLLLGPHLPSLLDSTVTGAFGDEHPAHGAFGAASTLGLFAGAGAFTWLLTTTLSAYLLTPVEDLGRGSGQRARWLAWWQELLIVLPSTGLRFGLMLLALIVLLPPGRRLSLMDIMLVLLLTPGSARQVIKLDVAYLLTAAQLRMSAGRWEVTDRGGERIGPVALKRRRRAAVRQALAEVRSGWLLLLAPAILLVEHNIVVGQRQLGEAYRVLPRLLPHVVLLGLASLAWTVARRPRRYPRTFLDDRIGRYESLAEDDVPFKVAVAFSVGLACLVFVLEPEQLRHTWWFVPLTVAPILAVIGHPTWRYGIASGLNSMAGLTAPVFFYVVGAEVAERMPQIPWVAVAVYCGALFLHPLVAGSVVRFVRRRVHRLGRALEAQLPSSGSAPWWQRRWRDAVRFVVDMGRRGPVQAADDEDAPAEPTPVGSELAEGALRDRLGAAFSDVSLVIVGLAFLGAIVPVEVAGLFVVLYLVGELLSTVLFGGRYFVERFRDHGPHEMAVMGPDDLGEAPR